MKLLQTSSTRNAQGCALRKGKKEKKGVKERGAQVQKMAMNKYLSIITLNVNGFNAPIKRHRIVEWIRKHDPTYSAYRKPTSEQKTQD